MRDIVTKIIAYLTAFLGVGIFLGLTLIAGSVVNGFVISTLWNWFMVPIFDLPSLSIIPAIGISIIINYFTLKTEFKEKDDDEKKKEIIATFMKPVIYLLIGYIIHLLM